MVIIDSSGWLEWFTSYHSKSSEENDVSEIVDMHRQTK